MNELPKSLMRLLPAVSFDMLSYAAGVSKLSFGKHVQATISGLIPLAVITTILGHSVSVHSPRVVVSGHWYSIFHCNLCNIFPPLLV